MLPPLAEAIRRLSQTNRQPASKIIMLQNSSNANARRIWEEISFHHRQVSQRRRPPEREFQIEMENAFEKLGWSRRLGEVIAQYTIPVGSAHSVRPDLIITKEGTPIFVVELKKPSSGATPRNADQLFSYMRLLKLNVGLLISDVVQLYYDDPSNAGNPRLSRASLQGATAKRGRSCSISYERRLR